MCCTAQLQSRNIACWVEQTRIGPAKHTRGNLPEQSYEENVVLVFETGHRRKECLATARYTTTRRSAACAAVNSLQLPNLLVRLDFFRGGKLSIYVGL